MEEIARFGALQVFAENWGTVSGIEHNKIFILFYRFFV